MARKRKNGFTSILASLPPDFKLGLSTQSTRDSVEVESLSISDDLIVQRVHVAQNTIDPETKTDADHGDQAASLPPLKKRKIANPDKLDTPPDSLTLDEQIKLAAPHYKTQKKVPPHLQKYFYQRYRYFSLYDQGCLLDDEGWYSVTPEKIANQIAERCRCDTVLDAFCGVGGNAIAFAQTCERVIALDISPIRLAIAKHNAKIYGVAERIEFILCDYVSFAKSFSSLPGRRIDVVFLSPPWGGPAYISGPQPTTGTEPDQMDNQSSAYSLRSLLPLAGPSLFAVSSKISSNIAMFLPRNTDIQEIASLVPPQQIVEIEEEWMGPKLKALTCYFGGLARGQGHLF